MKNRCLLHIIILLNITFSFGRGYLWPINSSRYLSSTFGEFRPGHFHSGIDVKTNYRTGYPVFAVENGYIWRIRTSPFGYGKAIYLKLDDGNLAVYGHLDEFNDPLRALVKAEQLIQRRYSTDQYFHESEIRVSKGDTLAFSGDTGTKHPHLHFELRDTANRPINPLNTDLKIDDSTIPTIKSLALVPIDNISRINGLPTIQIFEVVYLGEKIFTVTDTINVHGKIGVEIKTHDTVKGIPNKYPPYGIKMFVDDSLFFQVQYDTFDFDETRLVYLDRDFQLNENGFGHFNRLWMYNSLRTFDFYSNSPCDGVLELADGQHQILIEVYDRNFNTSTLSFLLYSGSQFSPALEKYGPTRNGYLLVFIAGKSDSITVSADWIHKDGSFQRTATIDSVRSDNIRSYIYISMVNYLKGDVLQVSLRSKPRKQTKTFFFNPFPEDHSDDSYPDISFIHNPRTFLCKAAFSDPPETAPKLFLQSNSSFSEFRASPLSPLTYISDPLPIALLDEVFSLEWRYNRVPKNILRLPVKFSLIVPGTPQTVTSKDSVFTVAFAKNSVYDSLLTWIVKKQPFPGNLKELISDIYMIYPMEQPLNKNIELFFKIPVGEYDLEEIGVYHFDDDEWNFVNNQRLSQNNLISATTNKTGAFALLKDNKPPDITNIFPGNNGRFRSKNIEYIKAIVKDDLSGIKDDTSITLTLDDRYLIAEYNGPKDSIRHKLSKPLNTGKHTITITVTDQANNSSAKTSTFYIY
jgi:hypothetical protein